jgi:hypothetical protein
MLRSLASLVSVIKEDILTLPVLRDGVSKCRRTDRLCSALSGVIGIYKYWRRGSSGQGAGADAAPAEAALEAAHLFRCA